MQLGFTQGSILPIRHAFSLADSFAKHLFAHEAETDVLFAFFVAVNFLQVNHFGDVFEERKLRQVLFQHIQVTLEGETHDCRIRVAENLSQHRVQWLTLGEAYQVNHECVRLGRELQDSGALISTLVESVDTLALPFRVSTDVRFAD